MRRDDREPRRPRRAARGFTLVELLVVIVIIGILLAFILSAAFDSIRRGEERQTHATVLKLNDGLTDRLDALAATRVEANLAHIYMSGIYNSASSSSNTSAFVLPPASTQGAPLIYSMQRAQVIARIDQLRAEIPDVFVVQGPPSGISDAYNYYPLNFAAASYPGVPSPAVGSADAQIHAGYMLPLGVGVLQDPFGTISGTVSLGASGSAAAPETTGIYGASYAAAAGLYKNLAAWAIKNGATPLTRPDQGYDGVDNDGDGLVDELGEHGKSVADGIITALGNHTHKTARAEALYALLVEGQGPFGSVFSPDDFSNLEVKDTDNDGLPEFVDAWGEPLQFYRWPIFFPSDSQKGANFYAGVFETRQQNPLDPNQQLIDPAWFSSSQSDQTLGVYTTQSLLSWPAGLFQSSFFTLLDPNADPSVNPPATVVGQVWDRGPASSLTIAPFSFPRRAYYSRPLIVSGGPDKAPGVPVLDPSFWTNLSSYYKGAAPSGLPAFGTGFNAASGYAAPTLQTVRVESQAAKVTPLRNNIYFYSLPSASTDVVTPALGEAAGDDITNHGLLAPGGAVQ